MKNRPRPNIPLSVQVLVAERQLHMQGRGAAAVIVTTQFVTLGRRLSVLLWLLFGTEQEHLDHDPPLRTRTYNPRIKDIAARYAPNANDPDHLIYRTVEAHKVKTNQRGDGAQFSDRVLIKRERKREKKATPAPTRKIAATWNLHPCPRCGRIHANGCPKRSGPIQNRSAWPKGRKIQNRRLRT